MGSLLDASPPVVVEDVDEVPPPSVSIEIDGGGGSTTSSQDTAGVSRADLLALEERVSTLLHVHSDEFRAVETRVAQLEQLKMAELMAAAAASAEAAAASAAQSAAEAAQLVKSAGEAVETAAAVMELAREAVKQISAEGVIPELLTEHCVNAAASARDVVCSCLEDARIDAEEFVEETRKHEQATAAASTGKRGGGKKR